MWSIWPNTTKVIYRLLKRSFVYPKLHVSAPQYSHLHIFMFTLYTADTTGIYCSNIKKKICSLIGSLTNLLGCPETLVLLNGFTIMTENIGCPKTSGSCNQATSRYIREERKNYFFFAWNYLTSKDYIKSFSYILKVLVLVSWYYL